jgi:hypothetical protein
VRRGNRIESSDNSFDRPETRVTAEVPGSKENRVGVIKGNLDENF